MISEVYGPCSPISTAYILLRRNIALQHNPVNYDRSGGQFRAGNNVRAGGGLGRGAFHRPLTIQRCVTRIPDRRALSGGLTPIIASALLLWTGATWPISIYLIVVASITFIATMAAPETAGKALG